MRRPRSRIPPAGAIVALPDVERSEERFEAHRRAARDGRDRRSRRVRPRARQPSARAAAPPQRAANLLDARDALFELHPGAARLSVQSRDGALSRDLDLALVVDGVSRPLVLGREELRASGDALRATFAVTFGEPGNGASTVDATLELRPDVARDALDIDLLAPDDAQLQGHTLGLRVELSSDGQVVFASGIGQIADRAQVTAGALVVDADPHPIGVVSDRGPVNVEALIEEVQPPGTPMRVAVTTPPRPRGDDGRVADLRIAVGSDSRTLWKALADLTSVPTVTVRGRVTGTTDPALVFGRDDQGAPQVRAHAADGGAFELQVPATVTQWYAAVDPGRSSTVVTFTPGSPHDLVLDVSPGGDLHVSIVDADTRKPLTARLLVHGIDGTVDPSFGPDYRASGAGPDHRRAARRREHAAALRPLPRRRHQGHRVEHRRARPSR